MDFTPLPIEGAWRILRARRPDERGFFARLWCAQQMRAHGLPDAISQVNTGFSPRAGTLRGLHWQVEPDLECKVVRCTRGRVFDVIVDLRAGSPTERRWHAEELSADNGVQLVVPAGCAHGYLTLETDCELMYCASVPYAPASARGVRFDDPALAIRWPRPVDVISTADRSWPLLDPR
jgi:dTDP-4-dehydrorhamnose 3,5-epimerase